MRPDESDHLHSRGDGILKILVVAPLPPPEHGGIVNWSRIIRKTFVAAPDVRLEFVDTMPRYRKSYDRSLAKRWLGGSVKALRDIGRVRQRLVHERFDVLHLCTSGWPATLRDILILRMARRFDVPSILHYRMGWLPERAAKKSLPWAFALRAMRLANVVVTLDVRSDAVVKQAISGHRAEILPNMVEIDAVDALRLHASGVSEAASPRHMRLLYVGHVLPDKGVRELVAAAARLREHGVLLDIVGPVEPWFRRKLLAIAGPSGAAEWLTFHDCVDHSTAIRHMLAADVFALPSYGEGAPNTVLEAMACGKPTVSCPVGAVPEMLDIDGPQECGLCVPCREVDALTSALESLIVAPEKRRALGNAARRRVEQLYAVPLACDRLKALWQSLVRHGDTAKTKAGMSPI
jgi:glycosyltransferase involved in cell wall biosynthesis